MIASKNLAQVTALLTVACIAGCGGGGGGSGGRDDLATKVLVSTPTMSSDVYPSIAGEPLKLVLNGSIKGDYEKLQGRSVYVTVEDGAGVFLPSAEILLTSNGNYLDYRLTLNGRVTPKADRLSGSVRIFVCLDRACETRLNGTPMTVSYAMTVENNLSMHRNMIDIEVPFGTVPSTEQVGVTWPASSNGYSVGSTHVPDPNQPNFPVHMETRNGVPSQFVKQPQFFVVFAPSQPGTYTATVQLFTEMRASYLPVKYVYSKDLTVKYTILPSPAIDHFFFPARSDFSAERKVGDRSFPFSLTTNTGVTQSYVGVEYLTSAGTAGPYNNWFASSPSPRVRPCGVLAAPTACLSAGVYTAQLRYRINSPAGERDVLYPIAMTVTP
jgi:hypothetical protein